MNDRHETRESFWELATRTLDGVVQNLSAWEGHVALIVNVASRCGKTPQYEGLVRLHNELAPRGFAVLAFPSNDFGAQEPGTAAEIQEFCSANYRVPFPLFEKRAVTGDGMDPIYRFLTSHHAEPDWNFTKYLVDHQGQVVARFDPSTEPEDAGLRARIDELMAARDSSAGKV